MRKMVSLEFMKVDLKTHVHRTADTETENISKFILEHLNKALLDVRSSSLFFFTKAHLMPHVRALEIKFRNYIICYKRNEWLP